MSIFSLLKEVVNEPVVKQIAKNGNESPEKIQKAVSGFSAAIVGGLLKRVTNEYGMNLVFSQVNKSDLDLSQLSAILKDEQKTAAMSAAGDKVLNTLLPGTKSPVSNMVARHVGTRNSLASSLSSIMMSVVVGGLKQVVSDKKLNAEGLANYLAEQREGMLSEVPDMNDNLIEIVGIQPFLTNFEVPRSATSESSSGSIRGESAAQVNPFLVGVEEESSTDYTPYLKWLGIAVLVGGLGYGAYYWWQNRPVEVEDTTSVIADTTATAGETEARTITEPPVADSTKKDTTSSSSPIAPAASGPMEAYMADPAAIKGKTFKLDKVDFADNSTQMNPEATPIVQGLTSLLKKYPSAEVKIIGYANDAKLPLTNKMLSVKRVYAIKQQLIDGGISFVRVDAAGLGNGVNPKDSTNRNRTPLREIYIKFIKK